MQKRRFTRVKFIADSKIEVNGQAFHGEILDIALKGALLRFNENLSLNVGDHCQVHIFLANSDVELHFEAEVAHAREQEIGAKFMHEDLETLMHLRNLISYNVGDADKVTDELSFL